MNKLLTFSLRTTVVAHAALFLPLTLLLVSPTFANVSAVSNRNESGDLNLDASNFALAQSFTTGDDGKTLIGVTVAVHSNSAGSSGMKLRNDNGGSPGTLVHDLGVISIPAGDSAPTFTPSFPVDLLPNTTYWVTLGEAPTGMGSFIWTATTSTHQTSYFGWTIADQALFSLNGGTSWTDVDLGPPNESCRLSVQTITFPDSIMVTRAQSEPVINSGPISFGLTELPAQLDVAILLGPGTPTGGANLEYGLDDVISANVTIGDGVFTELTAFELEIENGNIESLSATFAGITTPSVSDGGIVMNSPAFITGTDIASGQKFSYTYGNSTDSILPMPLNPPAEAIAVSNTDEPLDLSFGVNLAFAQSFTTGNDETTLVGVTLAAHSNSLGSAGMRLRSNIGCDTPGSLIAELGERLIPAGDSSPTFTPFFPVDLLPNTTYWLTLGEEGMGSGDFSWTATTSTNQTSSLGWTSGDQALFSNNGGTSWNDINVGPPNESFRFSVQIRAAQSPYSEVMVSVFNSDPMLDFGPLSFGLSELPAEVHGAFYLGTGCPIGGGAVGYGLDDVIGMNFHFGDFTGMNLSDFVMFQDPEEKLAGLTYAFASFNTPTVSNGVIEMNGVIGMNFLVTGTDIASGQPFSYTYLTTNASITFFVRGDVNVDGVVNLLDVAPFVDLLSAGTFQAEADVNQDGVVNLLDIQPFVGLLSGK